MPYDGIARERTMPYDGMPRAISDGTPGRCRSEAAASSIPRARKAVAKSSLAQQSKIALLARIHRPGRLPSITTALGLRQPSGGSGHHPVAGGR
jgi:hypothetical protein